ncbi:hypothetical protein GCM10011297_34100 [Bacterioplanes sanyensis]|uniref:immunity 49 family protein n=1 Tax=Bacterioplanes sanyensis TaxID=1249553 RepID=UPI0016793D4B|nr:immunity 49 family protein [Bacterioplanes sanyensis]GGY58619.1 hypothetical protein GCM10011297_34100 [Bacterioplanes sanyensis]
MIQANLTEEQYLKNYPALTKGIDRRVEKDKRKLPFFKPLVEGYVSDYQVFLACECYINPGKETTYYIMRRLQQFTLGFFQCPLHHGELFDLMLDDTVHQVYGDSNRAKASTTKWVLALQTAWVTRNQSALDYLLSQDFSEIYQRSASHETVYEDVAATYYALATGKDVEDRLLRAQFSPSTLDGNPAKLDRAELLLLPPIDVIATIAFEEGEARFNQAIENALLQHQRYYKKDPDIATPDTALSLPLMGLAALAYDRLGYRVTVENRYIPQWLVEHQDWSQLPPLADDSLRLNFPVRTRNPLEK